MLKSEIEFMREAIAEAKKAALHGDIPVGAVVVKDGEIIGRGGNSIELEQNPTRHAEIIAIEEAARHLGVKRMPECDIYVTLEPCAMCSGAIVLARFKRLIFGAYDPKTGASGSLYQITEDARLNHRCEVTGGILEEECSALLKEFFRELREKKK